MNKKELITFIETYGVCYSHEHCTIKGERCLTCDWKSTLRVTGTALATLYKE
jgi:hypothetical protein